MKPLLPPTFRVGLNQSSLYIPGRRIFTCAAGEAKPCERHSFVRLPISSFEALRASAMRLLVLADAKAAESIRQMPPQHGLLISERHRGSNEKNVRA